MQIGVFAFITNQDRKVLLVKDASREEKWTLPGGGLEFKELIPQALKREIKEEIGVDLNVGRLMGVFSQQKTPGIVFVFDSILESENFKPDQREVQDIKYFDLVELENIKDIVKPAQLSMIRQILISKNQDIIYNDFSI